MNQSIKFKEYEFLGFRKFLIDWPVIVRSLQKSVESKTTSLRKADRDAAADEAVLATCINNKKFLTEIAGRNKIGQDCQLKDIKLRVTIFCYHLTELDYCRWTETLQFCSFYQFPLTLSENASLLRVRSGTYKREKIVQQT